MKNISFACRIGVLAALFLLAAYAMPAAAQNWYPSSKIPGGSIAPRLPIVGNAWQMGTGLSGVRDLFR